MQYLSFPVEETPFFLLYLKAYRWKNDVPIIQCCEMLITIYVWNGHGAGQF